VTSTLEALLARVVFAVDFRVVFPDGRQYRHGAGEPAFTIRFRTEAAVDDCLRSGSLGFGDGYERGEIEVDGPLGHIGELGAALQQAGVRLPLPARLRFLIGYLLRPNSRRGARRNVTAHYDVGNDFYALWLDDELNYSCAYFEDASEPLEVAQRHKLDLVCRKLRLAPDMTVVDCGSGWGALALHAARYYGARVRGYTISAPQHEYSVARARALGLTDRVEFVLDDYRTIGRDGHRYDRFVSVGMFEHVGRANWRAFFRVLHRAVRPGGLSLLHTIARAVPRPPDPYGERIFPGFRFPTLADLARGLQGLAETLHVVDVENLRVHYALTLEHWYERFLKHRERIRETWGDILTRRYELYLACGPAWFRHDGVLLYQVLIAHGFEPAPPLTRRHMLTVETAPARS
jgi:cyclopropane-fatty-acyl-phospholipid synthase